MSHLIGCNEKNADLTSVIFLPKIYDLNPNETCKKPKLRDVLIQNNWPIVFKTAKVIQTKERLEFV